MYPSPAQPTEPETTEPPAETEPLATGPLPQPPAGFGLPTADPIESEYADALDEVDMGTPNRGGGRGAMRVAGVGLACVLLSGATSFAVVELTKDDRPTSGVSYVPTVVARPDTSNPTSLGDLHALLEEVSPSVVNIAVSVGRGSRAVEYAAGSGVIISSDGLLLTNAHVVQSEDRSVDDNDLTFTVTMHDGSVRAATVLGTAPGYDVALMQLEDVDNLTPLPLGDPDTFAVGDAVVAIGNALDLGDMPTVTTGIISALDRTLQVSSEVTLYGLIQTDAPINHGNSGGALINARGELIGINSAGMPDAQNLGFAISVATIKPLLEDLKAGETVETTPISFIGIGITETPDGVTVTDVQADTPADRAGLQAGDVLVSVAGTRITTGESLRTVLRATAPGTTVPIVVRRDGATQNFDITLVERPKGT